MSNEADTGTAETAEPATEFIVEAGTLNGFLDIVGALVEECTIHFEEDGLSVQVVDPANVAMLSTTLDTESMEIYNADGGMVGINISSLQDITDLGSPGDLLGLTLDPQTRKLIVSGDGFEYEFATIDPDSIRQEPEIPELELTTEFTIDSDNLERVVSGGDMVADHVTISPEPDESAVYIEADGDTDDLRFEFTEDDLEAVESLGDDESIFSLDYLEKVTGPMTGPVTARTGDELPIKFEYEAACGSVLYMMAPRIAR